jgi:hypothetical protein
MGHRRTKTNIATTQPPSELISPPYGAVYDVFALAGVDEPRTLPATENTRAVELANALAAGAAVSAAWADKIRAATAVPARLMDDLYGKTDGVPLLAIIFGAVIQERRVVLKA